MADPTSSAKPTDRWVVVHDSVAHFVKGCRLSIDDLYHAKLPGRDQHWQRLVDIGAIKPEGDPVAASLPVAEPLGAAAPIIMAGAEHNLTPMLTQRNAMWGIADAGSRDYPGAKADSTSLDVHADDAATQPPAPETPPPATTASRVEPDADTGGQPATGRSRR